jgi:RND family efflux transporter MFP subunit
MHANLEVIKASTSELRVNLIYASQTLERYKKLFDTKVVSQQQLDESQRSVDTLKAQIASTQKEVIASQARLRSAQQSLKNYTILAPFSGLIVSKNAQIGEMVSPVSAGGGYTRTGIATIVDMESLDIEVDINESNIAQVKVGQNAIAILDAYQGWKIPAKVKTIIPTADRQKATVKVRISFDVKDPKILPDMGVKVTFLDSNEKMGDQNPTIRIPKEALRKDNGGEFVYLYKNGFIERQPILTGEKSGALIEVSGGIRVDDMVVVESEANVKDGQKVQLASD